MNAGQTASKETEVSPRRLRQRHPKKKTRAQQLAEEFERDFDSENPSPEIQFNYTWVPKRKRRKSRRKLGLRPTSRRQLGSRRRAQKRRSTAVEGVLQTIPLQEVVVDQETRVYRMPNCGWNGMLRRVMQYKFQQMGMPQERDEYGNERWRGPTGVIKHILDWAGTSGWRSRKTCREVMTECLSKHAAGEKYDAGQRVKMQRQRKRKLNQDDVNLAALMLRTGAGIKWASTMVNHKIIGGDGGRSEGNVVCAKTVFNTLKDKYDATVHRRQKKGTGSRDKYSIWATARRAFTTQLYFQLGMFPSVPLESH